MKRRGNQHQDDAATKRQSTKQGWQGIEDMKVHAIPEMMLPPGDNEVLQMLWEQAQPFVLR
eukprot:2113891-Amphidinium_carterae.1